MIQGLVLTHGGIGSELLKVVESILGPVEGLAAATNQGCSARQVADVVASWASDLDTSDGGFVLIDDYGGSCAGAALLGGAGRAPITVVSGVNLPMLLAFVTWRDETPRDELLPRLVEKSRQAVAEVRPRP